MRFRITRITMSDFLRRYRLEVELIYGDGMANAAFVGVLGFVFGFFCGYILLSYLLS